MIARVLHFLLTLSGLALLTLAIGAGAWKEIGETVPTLGFLTSMEDRLADGRASWVALVGIVQLVIGWRLRRALGQSPAPAASDE